MKYKVFVTRPLPQAALEALAGLAEVRAHPHDAPIRAEELLEAARDADGLLVAGARITREIIQGATRLRAVSNAGVGTDNIDLEACTARGIPVTNTAGVLEETTADLAFALLLAAARRIAEGDGYVRRGEWRAWQWGLLHGADVHGKTLGIYGFGRIGRAVARRGRGFLMRILYYSRHRAPEAVERELEARYVERETLLRESDFVSLHVPLAPETRHAIGARELAWMKPTAFLINTARGQVVDEEALVQALTTGKIAGAALDVFEREPQVHLEFMKLANVVLAPHVGSATAETRFKMAALAGQNLLDLLEGRRPANVVNPEAYSILRP